MQPPETIKGRHIILHRVGNEHAQALFSKCWSDPAVMRNQDFAVLHSLSEAVLRLQASHSAWCSGQAFSWIISVLDSEVIDAIGCIELSQQSAGNYTLGYMLDRLHWGKGYITEAVRIMLEVVFGQLNANIVHGECTRDNQQSIRILEKTGFTRIRSYLNTRTLPNLPLWMPRVVDLYALSRDEFYRLRQRQIAAGFLSLERRA